MKKAARKKKELESPQIVEEKPKIVAEIEPEKVKKSMFKKIFSNKPVLIGGFVVLLIVIVAGVIYAVSYFAEDAKTTKPSTQEVQQLIDEVGNIVVLPQGETPTVATVTDVEKLASQPFFKDAQNGDKVIIFGNAKEAILYRPSIKKVIAMSPINGTDLNQPQNQDQSASNSAAISVTPSPAKEAEKIKVAVLNSTKEAGLAKKGGNLLDEDTFDVITTQNATGEYDKTTISVINKNAVSDKTIGSITSAFSKVKASTVSLPSGEAAPAGADVVIVLGSDFSDAY